MNCQSFEGVINELAREQMMDASVRAEALLHSGSCAICGVRLEDERLLTHTLREFSSTMRTVNVPPEVEQTLLAEFRQQQLAGTVVEFASRRRYSVYAAAAAALLLAFAVIAYQTILPGEPKQPVVLVPSGSDGPTVKKEQPETGSLATAASPEVAKPKPFSLVSHKRIKSHKPKPVNSNEIVAANHATTEVVSEFIPIGYSTAASVEDGAQLLRVEMPRSAMVRFGLPVNMERYNERVKADVLVSADGLARAIRFVQ
jgi:hypothetical protein